MQRVRQEGARVTATMCAYPDGYGNFNVSGGLENPVVMSRLSMR
jgi:hypothetical protein